MKNGDGWDVSELYVKPWAKYDANGTFLGWKVRLVQDILPEEKIDDESSCATTDLSVDNMEDEVIPDSEMKSF
jgi:hypothetical protein